MLELSNWYALTTWELGSTSAHVACIGDPPNRIQILCACAGSHVCRLWCVPMQCAYMSNKHLFVWIDNLRFVYSLCQKFASLLTCTCHTTLKSLAMKILDKLDFSDLKIFINGLPPILTLHVYSVRNNFLF